MSKTLPRKVVRTGQKKLNGSTSRRWTCAHCRRKNDPARRKCQGCGIGRATKRASLKARADAMARELCRLLADGKCARCSRPGSDWAHRLPRRNHSVRWAMDNCDFLCRHCHQLFTGNPIGFFKWLIGRVDMDALERRANEDWDKDYAKVIATLSAQLAEAKSGRAA